MGATIKIFRVSLCYENFAKSDFRNYYTRLKNSNKSFKIRIRSFSRMKNMREKEKLETDVKISSSRSE